MLGNYIYESKVYEKVNEYYNESRKSKRIKSFGHGLYLQMILKKY